MKRLVLFMALCLCTVFVYSQDLIVTGMGDSIHCRITKMKSGNVHFTFRHQEEIRNSLLPLTDVKDYQYGFFKEAEIPEGRLNIPVNYQRFRIALNGGFSYETARISKDIQSEFRDYVKELKSGYHIGGDVTYFFPDQLGVGGKFTWFHSTNSMDGIYLDDPSGGRRYGKMSDDIKVTFIGPSCSYRLLNQTGKNALIMTYAVGYMGFRNDFVLVDPGYLTGGTIGTSLDIGYDFGLSKNLALGVQFSLVGGTMSQYKLHSGSRVEKIKLEKDEYESLSRIDLSLGLRFNL